MVFKLEHTAGQARVANFLGKMLTPNFMMYTKRGAVPHLTADMLERIPRCNAMQLSLPELRERPGLANMNQFEKGLHSLLNAQGYTLYLTLRDPLLEGHGPANNRSISSTSSFGNTRVSPEQFMELQAAFRPDFFACISDEVSSHATASRARKAVQRTLQWLDKCIELHSEAAKPEAAAGESAAPTPLLFASLQGSTDKEAREHGAKQSATKDVAGFVLAGFGSGESAEQRNSLVESMIAHLPADKPRVMTGRGQPEDVLDCVERGVDLFEVSYPHVLTEGGFAAVFDTDPLKSNRKPQAASKISLRDRRFETDDGPLLQGCGCFACQNHTRAYVHHLLNTHEMLGLVLLQTHNLWHYSQFFDAIRNHVGQGTFVPFKAAFLDSLYGESN